MTTSLQITIEEGRVRYTESTIKMALKSEWGQSKVWILVEGSDDLNLYGKFFQPSLTKVVIAGYEALDGSVKGGKKPVEQIVKNVLADKVTPKIIGIRDRDYVDYYSTPYLQQDNIFLTDARDLEMMLLSNANVRKRLNQWTKGAFETIWPQCEMVSRYMAGYRVCNAWKHLNSDVKYFSTSSYWDFNKHTLLSSWQSNITNEFVCKCPDEIAVKSHIVEWLGETNLHFNLDKQDSCCFCRGHDVLSVLSYMLIKTDVYSQTSIMQTLIASYTIVDFEQTNLYKSIVRWGDIIGFDIFISTKA